MTDLPNGWDLKSLSSLVTLLSGFAYKSSDWKESGVPVLKITNVRNGLVRLEGCSYISKERATESKQFAVHNNDLLITMTGEIGATGFYREEFEARLNQRVGKLVAKEGEPLNLKYLAYFFESPETRQEMWKLAKGIAQANISPKEILNLEIPLPPLPEQHKIVEILEDHLSRLDVALADLKQAKVKAAQFRRSFIHDMTSSIAGSEVMGILDICDVYQPKTISTKELISDGEFPVYGANGQIGFYDKYNHEESEVTVTCRGATCGTVNVIPPMSWITGNAMVFKPKDNRIQKGFLEYVLRGMDWTPVITGTAQPQITRTSIQDLFIDVPNPQIQQAIYMKLESALTQVMNASRLCENVESQVASLRRSLLQAAFTGQLTKEVASV